MGRAELRIDACINGVAIGLLKRDDAHIGDPLRLRFGVGNDRVFVRKILAEEETLAARLRHRDGDRFFVGVDKRRHFKTAETLPELLVGGRQQQFFDGAFGRLIEQQFPRAAQRQRIGRFLQRLPLGELRLKIDRYARRAEKHRRQQRESQGDIAVAVMKQITQTQTRPSFDVSPTILSKGPILPIRE